MICCIKSHANWSPGPSAVIFLDHGLHEAIDWREETPDELIDYGKIPEFKPVVTYAHVPGMGMGFLHALQAEGWDKLECSFSHFDTFRLRDSLPPTSNLVVALTL